jgi:hypothetical protein
LKEHKKSELVTQRAALGKRREIELMKGQLQMEKAELKISTGIALKYWTNMKKIEMKRSETNTFAIASSSNSDQEQKNEIGKY